MDRAGKLLGKAVAMFFATRRHEPPPMTLEGILAPNTRLDDARAMRVDAWTSQRDVHAVDDLVFQTDDEIVVVDSGYRADEDVLSVAPWDERRSGRVVAVGRSGATRVLTDGLSCPMGICRGADGGLIVTLLERASIVDIAGKARQSGYPGYLGRIRKSESGYVLSCLARRDPLIEFLKTEKEFVAAMKANLDPRHWISPRVSPEFSHDFPIELGATRLFGKIKPWAPSFSYGLVIELDEMLTPTGSAHSRADGFRHAITDAMCWNGDLIAVSRASGEILNLGPGSRFA
jgi:hypothetical protein